MSVSAQILDVTLGCLAAGVRLRLERSDDDGWRVVSSAETDGDGYLGDWLDNQLEPGTYRIFLDIDAYYSSLGMTSAYSEISVLFTVRDDADSCQLQVLLAPYSYSLFFGSRR